MIQVSRCFSSRSPADRQLAELPNYKAYDNTFKPTHSISAFVTAFEGLEPESRLKEETVRVSGRILSKRKASSKLVFYDIESNGERLQVMASRGQFQGDPEDKRSSDDQFRAFNRLLTRGDVIGVEGFPGATGTGELSLIPRNVRLLSPCMQLLPPSHKGLLHSVSESTVWVTSISIYAFFIPGSALSISVPRPHSA